MNALINYLIDNLMLDFPSDLTPEMVREFLRNDKSHDAVALLDKLHKDRGINDMMITLADCLKEHLRTGITESVIREQLVQYSDS